MNSTQSHTVVCTAAIKLVNKNTYFLLYKNDIIVFVLVQHPPFLVDEGNETLCNIYYNINSLSLPVSDDSAYG